MTKMTRWVIEMTIGVAYNKFGSSRSTGNKRLVRSRKPLRRRATHEALLATSRAPLVGLCRPAAEVRGLTGGADGARNGWGRRSASQVASRSDRPGGGRRRDRRVY